MKATYKYIIVASLGLVGLMADAATGDEEQPQKSDSEAIVLDKKITKVEGKTDEYKIRLDSYVTGSATVTTEMKPVDLILVLDVSSSMDQNIPASSKYSQRVISAFG